MAYAGDVSSRQAWEALARDPRATLVDVRTIPEWSYVGIPVLDGISKKPMFVCWQRFPDMAVNEHFAEELAGLGARKDDALYFLCRSGARSRSAAEAMTRLGYTRCFNVADGFEGPRDGDGHRSRLAGWKASDLPWIQE